MSLLFYRGRDLLNPVTTREYKGEATGRSIRMQWRDDGGLKEGGGGAGGRGEDGKFFLVRVVTRVARDRPTWRRVRGANSVAVLRLRSTATRVHRGPPDVAQS